MNPTLASLGLAASMLLTSATAHAQGRAPMRYVPEGGGGLTFNTGSVFAPGLDASSAGLGGIGGKGVRIYDQTTRVGGEAWLQGGPMTSLAVGAFGDAIFASPANLRFYVGAGAGLGVGALLTPSTSWTGGFLYVQPELGVQINLRRVALEIEANYTLPMGFSSPTLFSGGQAGVSFGLLFGNFPMIERRTPPAPRVHPVGPAPRPTPPPPPRRPPPPPTVVAPPHYVPPPPPPVRQPQAPPPPPSGGSSAPGTSPPPPPKHKR